MTIPYTTLFDKFDEFADDFIEEINATEVVFHSLNQALTANTASLPNIPNVIDRLGGRTPTSNLQGHQNSNASQVHETTSETSLTCRVYWSNKNFADELKQLNVAEHKDICKIITYTTNEQTLLNATHAVVNGRTVKMIQAPLPYGFRKRYCVSYWEIAN